MNDYDVYYVDGRNATFDHRTGGGGGFVPTPGRVMVQAPQAGSQGVRTVISQPAQPYGQAQMYGPQGPGYWGPQGWVPQGPGAFGPQGAFGSSLLGRISTGQLIDLVAQVFAALNPLPAAPVATSEANTDVGNLILYQSSLASYAKKDEQVRTLGHLIAKLVG